MAAFSISDTGKLFYSSGAGSGGSTLEFVWVTREGVITPVDPGWSFDPGAGNQGWSLSPDGTRLAVREQTVSGLDIWIKELDDGPRFRLSLTDGEEMKPRWTPDGQTVLFLVGDLAAWSHSVRELFFVDESRDFVAAEIDSASGRVLNRQVLFPYPQGAPRTNVSILAWPAPDDQRFLIARPYGGDSEEAASEFVLVNNFFEELRQRVPN